MNQFDKYSEKTLLVWTCCWILVAVGLRLYMWDSPSWFPGSWTGHYPVWLQVLRSFAMLAALSGVIVMRLRRR